LRRVQVVRHPSPSGSTSLRRACRLTLQSDILRRAAGFRYGHALPDLNTVRGEGFKHKSLHLKGRSVLSNLRRTSSLLTFALLTSAAAAPAQEKDQPEKNEKPFATGMKVTITKVTTTKVTATLPAEFDAARRSSL
jgi:hypothetical protein